ncbi:hypothetical protein, partial [Desulfamplus magnetovallimortis]|uniref:hypothetical protein n=1 Tax=Desulfamplus magnetovallimortis TaxID=1246637 RepID=UPI00111B9DA2
MNYAAFRKSVLDKLTINKKVSNVCFSYLLFLMSVARKHSLEEAANFSGKNKSQFSRFLKNHSSLSETNLNNLSKKQSKILFKKCKRLQKGSLPWRVAIIVDATIQNRSSIHTENSQKFNHGNGYVIGHQWTNIVLIINEIIIPLMPIPFYSKNYCKKNKIKYKTEHEVVIEYFEQLNLYEYIGYHSPEEVVVLADSGYDDKRIENVIKDKKWH